MPVHVGKQGGGGRRTLLSAALIGRRLRLPLRLELGDGLLHSGSLVPNVSQVVLQDLDSFLLGEELPSE